MKRRKRMALGLIASLALTAVPTAARATDIVFDPTNYAKAVQQLQQDIQMVTALKTQIENQLKGLQNWGYSQLGSIMQSMNRWQMALNQSQTIYKSASPGDQLQTLYSNDPNTYASKSDDAMAQIRQQWDDRQRAALVENRTLQNQVEQDLEPTAQRIEQYIQKSNAAPGVTAAVQAGNEELATIVAQIQALEAMEVSDGRTDAEREAQLQAEDAYGVAEGQKVLKGMYQHSKSQTPVTNLFPHADD